MTLTAGTHLGPYEITSALGAGGMGEVYRAFDAKLNRHVALKILPELFALDHERIARFKREAQVLASLNHPNIAAIYGFEDSNGVQALILELVDGPTLGDRIAEGPIPLDEAAPMARQIAEALEAAHEQGIIHRDLKPANIKLRADGTVKVLDFGLAKALTPVSVAGVDATVSPTITSPAMTQLGLILGTAAYMSPEQAKGRPADKRSDVWAFGAVLYEMLSGERAFQGDDVSDTLAAVLRQNLDLKALPSSTPEAVRRLIARCLDRDVKQRLRDIGEARILLSDPAAAKADSIDVISAAAPQRPLWRRAIPAMVASLVAAALAASAAWYFSRQPSPPQPVTRFPFVLPAGQSMTVPLSRRMVALSPDGSQLVYEANGRLYRRSMSQLDGHVIQGTEGHQLVAEPVVSPDGQSVAFSAFADSTLKRVPITGGAAVTICRIDLPYGISWSEDGIVVGQGRRGILRVSPGGGTPEVIVKVKEGEEAHGPQLLPGGQHVLFTLAAGSGIDRWLNARVLVQSIASGSQQIIIEGGSDARYVPTGHLVYAVGGDLFAVPFDVRRLQITGSRVSMLEGIRRSAGGDTGAAHFSVSDTGTLIYVPGPSRLSDEWALAVIDRKGSIERLNLPAGRYSSPRVSPDGKQIAFETDDGKETNIYVYGLSGASPMQRRTFNGNNRFPIWTSDSRRIAFQSDREGDPAIYWQPADGTGRAERLTKPNRGESHTPQSWSPTGEGFLFDVTKDNDVSLWWFSLSDRKPIPFGDVHSHERALVLPTGARFSPDGQWVAYTIGEKGPPAIYVQPFPATGAKYQLFVKASDNTRNSPHKVNWSADGKELFYVPRILGFEAVSVTTRPTFAFGNPVTLPRPFQPGAPSMATMYDVTPDGKFLGRIPIGDTLSAGVLVPYIQVVLNWFEELRARVPSAK